MDSTVVPFFPSTDEPEDSFAPSKANLASIDETVSRFVGAFTTTEPFSSRSVKTRLLFSAFADSMSASKLE